MGLVWRPRDFVFKRLTVTVGREIIYSSMQISTMVREGLTFSYFDSLKKDADTSKI